MLKTKQDYILWFDRITRADVALVGGKNASLGEMYSKLGEYGIQTPNGFAVTAEAYRDFIRYNELEQPIADLLDEFHKDKADLAKTGKAIRSLFNKSRFPEKLSEAIINAYSELNAMCGASITVAVRSSATAEDLPEASFAGQQESFLNIKGADGLLNACRKCFASLFTDRAITYREEKGFEHTQVALSVGVQKMVRSDKASSGVMFSIDTESGFPNVIIINGSWGLGENIVKGVVNPDEYKVFKPFLDKKEINPILEKKLGNKEKKMIYDTGKGSLQSSTKNIATTKKERDSFVLNDKEILQLARWGQIIEEHYGSAIDIEWAKDGIDGKLYIVQARPETVHTSRAINTLTTYELSGKGKVLLKGLAIGSAVTHGAVQIIKTPREIESFKVGSILVTEMTDPDWVPIMKKAAGIITDHGGRTSHAAIVSRELGVPVVVGTGEATKVLKNKQIITLSCAQGEIGYIYDGLIGYQEFKIDLSNVPKIQTQIMMNIASPETAFRWWQIPAHGIGLARMEFIVSNIIKIHPMALVHPEKVTDKQERQTINKLTKDYKDKKNYFIDELAYGIAKIAASQYPEPVIVRMSDFKTNEYASLIGGKAFEPIEANPMLGFRGASRYYNDKYREGFALECAAVKKAREEMGFTNIIVMIPFCRTLNEADLVLKVMAANGLQRGVKDLQVYVMCEIPSNVILAEEFAERFDGFSIGSNDLTQLVLGVDRDSAELKNLFDENNEAVKIMISDLIKRAHAKKAKVSFCGQAPSDKPGFAEFLVEAGIDSISLNPDSVVGVVERVAEIEKKKLIRN